MAGRGAVSAGPGEHTATGVRVGVWASGGVRGGDCIRCHVARRRGGGVRGGVREGGVRRGGVREGGVAEGGVRGGVRGGGLRRGAATRRGWGGRAKAGNAHWSSPASMPAHAATRAVHQMVPLVGSRRRSMAFFLDARQSSDML